MKKNQLYIIQFPKIDFKMKPGEKSLKIIILNYSFLSVYIVLVLSLNQIDNIHSPSKFQLLDTNCQVIKDVVIIKLSKLIFTNRKNLPVAERIL